MTLRRDKCQKKLFKAHGCLIKQRLCTLTPICARHADVLLSVVKSPSAARFVPKCGLILFQDRGGTPVLDELGDNRPKRAEMKMPHHRVAANGNSAERRGTSWRSMLIMLFKLVVTLEDIFKVCSSERE